MTFKLPMIDDKDYQQLLADALARVRIHTPEWTNLGESDPGVTILELFAYLTESLLYRANQIPERNRLKFLSLLGMRLQPALPALGVVAFSNTRGPMSVMPMPAGSPLAAGQLGYVTTTDLELLPVDTAIYRKAPVKLEAVPADQVRAIQLANPGVNVQIQAYATQRLPAPAPQAPLPSLDLSADTLDGSLWLALFCRAGDTPEAVLGALAGRLLSLGVVPSFAVPEVVLPAGGTADPPRVSPLTAHAGLTPLLTQATADVLTTPGVVQIRLPGAAELRASQTEGDPPQVPDPALAARLLAWVRITIACEPGKSSGLKLVWAGANAAMVAQQSQVDSELLGRGNGKADQSMTLVNKPVLPQSVRLYVGGVLWQQVDDLMSTAPEVPLRDAKYPPGSQPAPLAPAQAYTLNAVDGTITFGDGMHGARPAADAEIRASYAYSGGAAGNVDVGAVNKGPYLPPGVTVTNPVPTWGGDDAQSMKEAEQSIPAYLQTRDRMVTVADFKALVTATPGVGVGRVEVLPLYNPTLPWGVSCPGTVCILVIPSTSSGQSPPAPDQRFLSQVSAQIEPRRLLTTEVWVRGPVYKPVQVTVSIKVAQGYAGYAVQQAVVAALGQYLSPLTGGQDGAGWPLNTPVTVKELTAQVDRVSGVDYVQSLLLADGNGIAYDSLSLSGLELPWLQQVEAVTAQVGPAPAQSPPPAGPQRTVFIPVRSGG